MKAGQLIEERYRLVRSIGAGGFGAVWLAEEITLGRQVAIKFLKRELARDELVRFRREVQALGRLTHDHILTLYNVGEHAGARYIVTEFVRGHTLDEWSPRSTDDIVTVGTQIAAALAAAHREGIVHRDLKPANVMVLQAADGALLVKVLDFGIAKLAGPKQLDITQTGDVIGTPGFMSPEQLRGVPDIGPATDLYNLGVILWELLEGRPIFTGGTALEISMQHLVEPVPLFTKQAPEFLHQLTRQLLEKDPARRGSAAAALRALHERQVSFAAPPSGHDETSQDQRPVVIGLVVLGIALVVAIAWVGELLVGGPPPPVVVKPRPELSRTPPPATTVEPPKPVDAIGSATTTTEIPDGCGNEWTSGPRVVSEPDVRERTVIELYRDDDQSIIHIPRSYDPTRHVPLVTVLHSGGETPQTMYQEAKRLIELADARGFLVLFPEGVRRATGKDLLDSFGKSRIARPIAEYPWKRETLDNTMRLVALAQDILCVDEERMFLVGHGRGARAAEMLLLHSDAFAAVAMSDYRRKAENAFMLEGRLPIPYLWLTATDSDGRPDDGKRNDCLTGHDLTPRERQERDMLEHNRCSGPGREVETSTGATCVTWDCEATFVSCRVSGGQHWQDYPEKPGRCYGPRSSYDYGDEIWNFFQRVSEQP